MPSRCSPSNPTPALAGIRSEAWSYYTWPGLSGPFLCQSSTAPSSDTRELQRDHLAITNGRTDDGTPSSDRVESSGRVGFAFRSRPSIFPGRPARPPHQVCRLHPGTLSRFVIVTRRLIRLAPKTPDTGVNVELSSVIKQTLDSKPSTHSSARPLGWLRTMVEFDRSLAHQWPADCNGISSLPHWVTGRSTALDQIGAPSR